LLEVRDVLKQYDGRAVVNRVSFQVRPGEIFALLGPNGAGKTTLIRMITDILKPDAGTLTLDGDPVGGGRKRDVGYLPEERGLYRSDKVVETLAYFGRLKGMKAADAKRSAAALLERVELGEWMQKPVQQLSKGMQQKVQLCTAMIGDPRVLILDEPFSGLDPVNVQMLEEILHERRAAGTTILLSTHQMNKIEELCDRALMIHHGHMVLYGAVGELRRRHADHAVVVRLEDRAAAPRLAAVAGVQCVEPLAGDHKLTLDSGATQSGVLRALLDQGIALESFSHAIMPLEDVFVKVVREGLGLDRGRSEAEAPVEEAVR
jgi:ABC-2 type transport system ATP-binding protein